MGIKQLSLILALLLCICLPDAALAELYGWIDENGVKHFSNNAPPEGVKSFTHTHEIQSRAIDTEAPKIKQQKNQQSAPTASDEDELAKPTQEDSTPAPQIENDTLDETRVGRGGVYRYKKQKRQELIEEQRKKSKNGSVNKEKKHQSDKNEPEIKEN